MIQSVVKTLILNLSFAISILALFTASLLCLSPKILSDFKFSDKTDTILMTKSRKHLPIICDVCQEFIEQIGMMSMRNYQVFLGYKRNKVFVFMLTSLLINSFV